MSKYLFMSMWKQIMFQDPNSSVMENMVMFYDYAMLVVVLILSFICYMLINMFLSKLTNLYLYEGQVIEVIWTILPMLMLIFLSIPSLKILYMTDELNNPILSVKSLGHQWYWSYEYSDFSMVSFDSFMLQKSDMEMNSFRLLDVDNRMVLPIACVTRNLISSSDVIHSFAIPSMGVKVDALPGRINQVSMLSNRPGLFFGQCSEICGVNHSFMPIVMEVTSVKSFMNWINSFN